MSPKKAIEILNIQKSKIDTLFDFNDGTWETQTVSYIKDFFGENSPEHKYILNTPFYISSYFYTESEVRSLIPQKKNLAKTFIDNCIQTIEHKGIFKPPKQNFLSRLSDTAIWTLIGTILPIIITASYVFGESKSSNKIERLEIENQKLRDTISSIRVTAFPNSNPITNTDTTKTQ